MLEEEKIKKQCDFNVTGTSGQEQIQSANKTVSESLYHRPSLAERLEKSQAHAKQEQRMYEKRAELLYLLNKNPEIARILDLIAETNSI